MTPTLPGPGQQLDLVLRTRRTVADGVVELTLVDPDGAGLPPWAAGPPGSSSTSREHPVITTSADPAPEVRT